MVRRPMMFPIPTALDIRFSLAAPPPSVDPFSARAMRGTLSPIDLAKGNDKLARTVNGTLIDISAPQMRKYRLQVNGQDHNAPALDGLWVGISVVVNSHVEIGYLTSVGAPARMPVPGSTRTDGDFTYYCPQFEMRIVELQIERAEWEASVTWSLVMEEI
jgi:hypothetical protein